MRRALDKKEKGVIRYLLNLRKETYRLTDFLTPNWPTGKLEISTFQQVIQLYLDDPKEMQTVMNHLSERLGLVKYLADEGYLSFWNRIPDQDDTVFIGNAVQPLPAFLPDIALATELLKYANFQIVVHSSLKALAGRKFRYAVNPEQRILHNFVIVGLMLFLLLAGSDIYLNYRLIRGDLKSDHDLLGESNKEVLKNQALNQKIIDSLRVQNVELIGITNRISVNTENIIALEKLMLSQSESLKMLESNIQTNQKLLLKSDSLLNFINKQ
jgi:hypothetical protein